MCRSTVIFGNGLGMALNPEYFSLKRGMEKVWDDKSILNGERKEMIRKCLPADKPTNEEDLNILHMAINACELLDKVAEHKKVWLSDSGIEFPNYARTYLTKVAWYFHKSGCSLPREFYSPFFSFLKDTYSHVATLNYDNILYQKMIG